MSKASLNLKLKAAALLLVFLSAAVIFSGCGAETPAEQPSEIGQQTVLIPENDAPEAVMPSYEGLLKINEVMVKNRSMFPVRGLMFPDWIELYNISGCDVDLSGWSVSTENSSGTINCLSSTVIGPGEYALIYAASDAGEDYLSADISLKPGCAVSLSGPDGIAVDTVLCEGNKADVSFIPQGDGTASVCSFPTPGMENINNNYDLLMGKRTPDGPLVINEVMGGNINTLRCNTGYEDWIELKNISDHDVNLSGYYLSDSSSDYRACQLPDTVVGPGGYAIVWCSGDASNTTREHFHADFKIDSVRDTVFLFDGESVIDSISYHDVPAGGTTGHGADGTGIYVFTEPTPRAQNAYGFLRMSAKPASSVPDGIYEDSGPVQVELSAAGTIYYTTDGSTPTVASAVYSEPIEASDVTVIRAIAVEPGCTPSTETVLSFFINKGHTLPVLSLTVDKARFSRLYYGQMKNSFAQANLALYGDGEGFNAPCGFCMKGWTSLSLPKKSMGVTFSGKFGGEKLDCDVFGTGVTGYSNLSIRAGQDYTTTIVRNELMQELCLELSDSAPTQNSKYCVLYINGEYWGIYCLKEDVNAAWYAGINGIDKSDVLKSRSPAGTVSPIREFLDWSYSANMADPANYARFCESFDEDALIDWIIMEGYSGNTDINGNMKYFRSTGGKWQIAYYDLDWALLSTQNGFNTLLSSGDRLQVYTSIIRPLLKNDEFKEKLCRRAAEALSTVLSDEHVAELFDRLIAEIEPEVAADRLRWSMSLQTWENKCRSLRSMIADKDYDRICLTTLMKITKAPEELQTELLAMLN